jgi:[acyl-carrier-protein] S-malonyltransferase
MMPTALLFPGQGSQTSDMRALVAEHEPELLALAQAEAGEDVFERAGEGTAYAQPSILCASIASWVRAGRPGADYLAGHSLGELSALVAAGSIPPDGAVRLAAERGRLMAAAAGDAPGGMMALLGDATEARAAADEAEGVVVANDNGPTQLVVAGPDAALDQVAHAAKERGVRAMRLAVRGAFHSTAIASAVDPFRLALERTEVRTPQTPVFSSSTAEPFPSEPDDIRDRLALALVRPVHWRQVLERLHELGVRRFIEAAPGKVLTGMVRRAFDDVEATTLESAEVVNA